MLLDAEGLEDAVHESFSTIGCLLSDAFVRHVQYAITSGLCKNSLAPNNPSSVVVAVF